MANRSGGTGQVITGHLELLYPSEYLKAADLRGKDINVVIDHAEWEDLVMQGGKRDRKVALHIRSVKGVKLGKRWIVGKTVLRQIAATLGGENDVGKWNGGKVTIYPTTCRGASGGQVECIRVRVRVNTRAEEPTEDMTKAPEPRVDFVDEAGEDERQPGEEG